MLPGALENKYRAQAYPALIEIGLLVLSAALFAFSFPSVIDNSGWGFLAYVCLIPAFLVFNRSSWPRIFLYGPFFGFLSYLLFNYWLAAYHPLAVFIVPVIYAVYYALLFPLFTLSARLFPRYGYIVQAVLWVAYEYLKTTGFLSYPYGILGYTQYLNLPLVNVASLTGIWGVSFLTVLPSLFLAFLPSTVDWEKLPFASWKKFLTGFILSLKKSLPRHFPFVLAYAVIFAAAYVYGTVSMVDYSGSETKRFALIQQNVDPWIGGYEAYAESLKRLKRQTDAALASDDKIDMVVWSETSFVPAIEYHERYRKDLDRYLLVKDLKDYMESKTLPFLLGNGDAELVNSGSASERRDYNSVLLYEGRTLKTKYRKVHLVPFTEHFPYRNLFPWFYQLLVDNNTSFWTAGDKISLMEEGGLIFGTPICFEDTFGYLSREMVRQGAMMIVNLSNDSWSKSVPACMQHLAMAVFRAAEVKRTLVRSTNGGMSVLIDPNGKILKMNEAFTESFRIVDAPVSTEVVASPYLIIGDVFGQACVFVFLGLILIGIFFYVRNRPLTVRRFYRQNTIRTKA